MTSLEQHPIQPWPALPACLCVPVRHATARCPDQTIVAVLVRLAFFSCDTDNICEREHTRHGTAQHSTAQDRLLRFCSSTQ